MAMGTISRNKDDRLSALPEEILIHILSFLPTKDAVATSALSTTWKFIYKLLDVVDMDDSLYPQDMFIDVVYTAILIVNGFDISRFRLKCHNLYSVSELDNLICASICHNVRILDIEIEGPQFALTKDLFRCETLVDLRLHGVNVIVPKKVYLPNLKFLKWYKVRFLRSSDDSLKRFFLGCTRLESLAFHRCLTREIGTLDISNPSLLELIILGCESYFKLLVDAPSLLSLTLLIRSRSASGEEHVLRNLRSLRKALGFSKSRRYASWFLPAMSNEMPVLESLFLASQILQGIKRSVPEFQNMIELAIAAPGHPSRLEGLRILLRHTPHLEKMWLYMDVCCQCPGLMNDTVFLMRSTKPNILVRHLKTVYVVNCNFSDYELYILNYILQQGEVLEQVVFCGFKYEDAQAERAYSALIWLLTRPRCSKTCKFFLQ